jgi:hypothetical protein
VAVDGRGGSVATSLFFDAHAEAVASIDTAVATTNARFIAPTSSEPGRTSWRDLRSRCAPHEIGFHLLGAPPRRTVAAPTSRALADTPDITSQTSSHDGCGDGHVYIGLDRGSVAKRWCAACSTSGSPQFTGVADRALTREYLHVMSYA